MSPLRALVVPPPLWALQITNKSYGLQSVPKKVSAWVNKPQKCSLFNQILEILNRFWCALTILAHWGSIESPDWCTKKNIFCHFPFFLYRVYLTIHHTIERYYFYVQILFVSTVVYQTGLARDATSHNILFLYRIKKTHSRNSKRKKKNRRHWTKGIIRHN